MGSLQKMHRQGRFWRKKRVNRNPLRKIVGWDTEAGLREVLECGHRQYPVQDFIGATVAVRRRCRECGKQKEKQS